MIIDLIIAGILILFTALGYRKGFAGSILFLLSWIAAVAGGFVLYDSVRSDLEKFPGFSERMNNVAGGIGAGLFSNIISFIAVVLAIKLVLNVIFYLLRSKKKIPVLSTFNKLLGAGAGLAKGIIIIWIVSLAVLPFVSREDASDVSSIFNESKAILIIKEFNPVTQVHQITDN